MERQSYGMGSTLLTLIEKAKLSRTRIDRRFLNAKGVANFSRELKTVDHHLPQLDTPPLNFIEHYGQFSTPFRGEVHANFHD